MISIRRNASASALRMLGLGACVSVLVALVGAGRAFALESFQAASDVLGQNDGLVSAPAPIYTKGTANNAAHKLGQSAPGIGQSLDVTDHRLFIADTGNHRVLVYNLDVGNDLIDRIPDNVIGQPFFWSNAAANTQAGMNTPNGLAYDDTNNRLFVAQGTSTTSARVTVYDVTAITDGEDAINVLGQASFTVSTAATTQEGLNLPMGMDYDATNSRLFVVNNGANRVTVYNVATIEDGEAATNVLGQTNFTAATAATTQAGLNVPHDALYDSANNRLFVSDGTSNRVVVYNVAAITDGESAVNVLGQTTFTASTAATTQIGMNAPRGLAYDDAGQILYVVQTTANRVTAYDVTAITDGENAVSVLGQTTFTTSTAATTQAGMNAPIGALLDDANDVLYVAQTTGNRVTLYDVVAITNGESAVDALGQHDDSLSAPGPIYTKTTAQNASHKLGLNAPQDTAIDTVGHRLFVSDMTNNRVLVYNLDAGNALADRIPDNVLGQANYYSNAVATTQTGLNGPTGLTYDAAGNRLFVTDMTNNRIIIYDVAVIADGENAVNVLGQISYTVATAAITQVGFNAPRQSYYDATTGSLYVADAANNRVMVFDAAAVSDGENAVDVIGQNDGLVGSPQPIFTKGTANNAAHKLGLSAPAIGLSLDVTNHRLFVADTGNNRVLVYNLDASNVLLDRTPDNVLGQLNFYANAAGSTRGGLNVPNGLTYDYGGKRLFVAQATGNRVSVFDVAAITDGEDAANVLGQTSYTVITAATTQAGLNLPTGVTYDDSNDRLYVAQNTANRVSVFSLAAGAADYPNADNALGQNDGQLSNPQPIYTKSTVHNGPNKLGLSAPIIGVAMDTTDHRLFVSDTSNHRVLVYNLDVGNALIDLVPDNVLGQANFYTNAAANSQTGLNAPNGLDYDVAGKRLFVAETSGNRVKVFDATTLTDGEGAAYVLGQTSFTAATAASTQAGMNVPTGVAYGGSGSRLYVAQNTANRVTVYNVADGIANGENAVAVLGQTTFTTSTAATTQAGMNVPYDVALSGSTVTTLFVSQGTANRVTAYDVTTIANGENAVKVLGQANFTNSTAATTQVGMNAPRGIAYNNLTQTLYVSQTTANRVTAYNLSNGITDGESAVSVLGQANFTTSTAATTQAGMNAPTGTYVDRANNILYVPQSGASRVSMFDVAAITDGESATNLLGQYDDNLSTPGPIYTKSTAHNGPSKLGLSAGIIGLELDPTDHRLFVSDTGNNRVLVYNLDSNDLLLDRIPDFVLGQVNFYSNAAATTQAGMNVPNGLAYDDAGDRLFVAQSTGNRVTVYNVAAITDGENAVNVLGQTTFTGTTAATTQTGMNAPAGLTYHATSSRLFVPQTGGNRVTVYDVAAITDGENAVNVLGQAAFTTSTAATTQTGMNVPYDTTLSGSTVSTLFVSQGTGNRVTLYDVTAITDGENAVKVLGQTTFTGTAAASTQAGMNAPRGISYDPIGKKLYVAQTAARVTAYALSDGLTDGENAITVIGQPTFTTSTAAVFQEGLSTPTGVLVDEAHTRLYVMDSTTNRVLSYPTNAGIGNGENAVSVLGQADFVTSTAATTQAGMNVPYDVALSGSTLTTLFVSQGTANRVTLYDVTAITNGESAIKVLGQTTFTGTAAATTQAGMNAPRGLAYHAATKTLYVSQATANRVTSYDLSNGVTDGENAINVLGQPNFIVSTAGTRQSGLNAPSGLAIGANNDLFVLQSGASRVSAFNIASISDGENAVDVLGQTDNELSPPGPVYTKGTANNAAYKLGLSGPQGVVVDTVHHRLFVSDTGNNRVLEYNLDSGNILVDTIPDKVLGQPNFYYNAVATTQAGLSSPTGLAYDAAGDMLYVSDLTNNRIVVYNTASITDGENAVAVLGQPSFLVATAGTTQLGLSGPRLINYDASTGRLYVGDGGNSRVIIYDTDGDPVTGGSGSGTNTNNTFYFFGY